MHRRHALNRFKFNQEQIFNDKIGLKCVSIGLAIYLNIDRSFAFNLQASIKQSVKQYCVVNGLQQSRSDIAV